MSKKSKLTIPCSYQGGKSRIAKEIVDVFYKENNIDENTKFYDLCCGSGAISIELINRGLNPNTLFDRVEIISDKMEGVIGINGDVTDKICFENNSIIYIDPPYKNTTGYGFNFNIDSYIHTLISGMKLHKKQGKIYVSEGYKMNDNAFLVASKRGKGGISGDRENFNEEWLNVFTV